MRDESWNVGGEPGRLTEDPERWESGSSRQGVLVTHVLPDEVPPVVRAVATSDATVLVVGETGVGKEVLAQTIHQLSGRTGTCVRVNCAALTESLFESQLFGHERGAFTGACTQKIGVFEAACGGTLFLDEIGELSLTQQAKLLRAVETREVIRVGSVEAIAIETRIVAATNRDLAEEVAVGRFRADLFYRLDGITLEIPPLRERRDQIVPLAKSLFAASLSRQQLSTRASDAFFADLARHDWPGNVRELRATIERAILLAGGATLVPRHIVHSRRPTRAPASGGSTNTVSHNQDGDAQCARARIVAALQACAGNQTRAARHLGMSRALLSAKLTLYGIPRPRTSGGPNADRAHAGSLIATLQDD